MQLFELFGTIAINGVEKASEGLEKISNSAKKVGEKVISAGDKVEKVGKKMTTVLTVPLTTMGTLAGKTAASFEDGMLKVQSLSGATDSEFQKLTETAKKFGASTAWSASQVADAMGYMALAGFDTNDILESTSGMLSLASASGEDLATVTDILTDSMTAFGDGADQASRYADVLATTQAKSNTTVGLLGEAFKYVAPLAGSYGYKLEDVSAALGMMANAGVKGSMAGTSLSSIITRLGVNTDGCREKIESLGVQFYNQDGTARDLSSVLMDLTEKTKDMTVEQKSALAKTVAGQEAQKGLLAILNQGSDAYANLQEKIENCDGAAEKMATNMESGLGGSLRSMKSAMESAAITLGDKLAPYIEAGAEKIKQLCTWFTSLDSSTQDTIVKIGLLVAAAGPLVLGFGKIITITGKTMTAFGTLGNAITSGVTHMKKIIEAFQLARAGMTGFASETSALGTALAEISAPLLGVVAAVGVLIAVFMTLWNTNEEFRNSVLEIWNSLRSSFSDMCSRIVEAVNSLGFEFSNITEVIKGVWQGLCDFLGPPIILAFTLIQESLSAAFDLIASVVEFFCALFSGDWQGMCDALVSILEATGELLFGSWNTIFERISSIVTAILNRVTSIFEKIRSTISTKVNAVKQTVQSVFEAIRSTISSKLEMARQNVDTALELVRSTFQTKLTAAKQIVSNIFEAIKAKIHEVMDNAREKVQSAIDKMKAAFKFTWSLPHLKLPHVHISGHFSLNPPSAPHFSVEWYKKAMNNPLLMTRPTAFGINGLGQIMAGGEAGPEVVSGADTLMDMIQQAVSAQNTGLITVLRDILEAILSMSGELGEKMRDALDGASLDVDGREFARIIKAVE